MSTKRDIFAELMGGISAAGQHRSGKLTLRSTTVADVPLPALTGDDIIALRETLGLSRPVFARLLRINPRTLERWEQGRSKPAEHLVLLLLLVQRYPDTIRRISRLSAA